MDMRFVAQPDRADGGRAVSRLASRLMWFLPALFLFAACRAGPQWPEVGRIYAEAARYHGPERNPVVLIPGFTGSKLVESADGSVVWGAFSGEYANPSRPEGARALALPMAEGTALEGLFDGVRSDGALDRIRLTLFGIPIQVIAYRDILTALGVGGYRDEALGLAGYIDYGKDHFTCFQFDYDWRRSIPENAARLATFLEEKAAYVESEWVKRYGPLERKVHFDLVAHSMGGLVARWFLMYGSQAADEGGAPPELTWEGARRVDRAILVATPNAGSLESLEVLVGGYDPGLFIPNYPPAVLGTFPSLYEMLPRARHGALVDVDAQDQMLDPFDPALWEQLGWGLADPDQDRVLKWLLPDVPDRKVRERIARDHLGKCLARARAVTDALDRVVERPADLGLYVIAGDGAPTHAVAGFDRVKRKLIALGTAPGDGTVTRSSVLCDERLGGPWRPELVSPIPWTQALFLQSDHLELTRDPVFVDYVLYLLLEAPRSRKRTAPPSAEPEPPAPPTR